MTKYNDCASDIRDRARFDIIRYSNCWEDSEILVDSLNISNDSRCFSVSSAGDNSLSLLVKNPLSVVAFDLSKVQLACAELKALCFKHLEYEETLSFLGFANNNIDRIKLYNSISSALSEFSKTYWDNNLTIIEDGIIYAGKFENYFKIFAKLIVPLIHNKQTLYELLQEKSLDEREKFYSSKWNNTRWNILFKIFFSRLIMGYLGRDPEFFKYVEGNVSDNILKRTEYAFTQIPTHNNSYLNSIMTADYTRVLPFYMQEENYLPIKTNIDKLSFINGDLIESLNKTNTNFDCFNLSDIFEYMDEATFKQNVDALLKHANSGARFAYWNMLVNRQMSLLKNDQIRFNRDLSESLFKKDKAFFYKSFYLEEKV